MRFEPDEIKLNEEHGGGFDEGVGQPEHAQVSHFMFHNPQVHRDEELKVAPQDAHPH